MFNFRDRKVKTPRPLSTDDFETPPEVLDTVLDRLPQGGKLWDPFPGSGRSADYFEAKGFEAHREVASDFFATTDAMVPRDAVLVSNPPFSKKVLIFEKLLALGVRRGALLLPSTVPVSSRFARFQDGLKSLGVHKFQLLPHGQVRFLYPDGSRHNTASNFYVVWITWGLDLPGDLLFRDRAVALGLQTRALANAASGSEALTAALTQGARGPGPDALRALTRLLDSRYTLFRCVGDDGLGTATALSRDGYDVRRVAASAMCAPLVDPVEVVLLTPNVTGKQLVTAVASSIVPRCAIFLPQPVLYTAYFHCARLALSQMGRWPQVIFMKQLPVHTSTAAGEDAQFTTSLYYTVWITWGLNLPQDLVLHNGAS